MKSHTRRTTGVVVPVNPLVIATSGMSADSGNLMPSAIHGSMVGEDSSGVQFMDGLSEEEVGDMLDTSPNENTRFEADQFRKYFGSEVEWCALVEQGTGNALAISCFEMDNPFPGYCFISEVQNLKKGYGKPLMLELFKKHGTVWLMSNPDAGESLSGYYRKLNLEQIEVPNSIYGGTLYFFATKDCDLEKLNQYCQENFQESGQVSESSGYGWVRLS